MSVTTWTFLGVAFWPRVPVLFHWLRSPVSKSALKMTLANKPVDRIHGSEYLSSVFDVIWIVCHTGYNLGMTNTRWLHLLAGMSALTAAASIGGASQFVLFDVTFTYTKADADNSTPSKSHYYVKGGLINPDRPRDWTSPVDYRNGTVHIRTEVIEKPAGGEPTTWTLCYIPNKGQGNGYGCTGTVVYREKGIYEQDVSMTSWWENHSIVWTEGIKQMDLVIKDNSGGGGHAHKRADAEHFFPTKMRITMIQVSAGSTYDPSLVPNLSPAGASA